jgi:hypothetical protein
MEHKNLKIVTYISLGGMCGVILALLGFVWSASAKTRTFEMACEKLEVFDKVQVGHSIVIGQHNTAIAVIDNKLDTIIKNQEAVKKDFDDFKKEFWGH